jgi:multidrug efflux pump subunit AcrB
VGRRILPAVVGSTLTTAVVLFPFLYLQGNARAAFVPFAAAFVMALGWSVLSSVVMIPAVGIGTSAPMGVWPRLHNAYLRSVGGLLRWRWVTIGVVTVILGVVTWGFTKRVQRFSFGNWYGQRSTLSVSIQFPRGSDPESVDRAVQEFERIAVGHDASKSTVEDEATFAPSPSTCIGGIPSILQTSPEFASAAACVGYSISLYS